MTKTHCGKGWGLQDVKGKGKLRDGPESKGTLALDVPLELLCKPICKRSSAHLEAALHVIEVSCGCFPELHACTIFCKWCKYGPSRTA